MAEEHTYRVTTEGDEEGRGPLVTLGYAIGKEEDIKAFFDNKKYYNIYVEPIEIFNITPEALDEKMKLVSEREKSLREIKDLEQKIRDIQNQIKVKQNDIRTVKP